MLSYVCSALCMLSCAGLSAADNVEPSEGASRLSNLGKCGRDCVVYICRCRGLAVEAEEIDRELRHRSEVSFSDLRRVFESKGLYCHAFGVNISGMDFLGRLLFAGGPAVCAIAALPTKETTHNHFVVIEKIQDGSCRAFDPAGGGLIWVDFEKIGKATAEIAVFVVGTRQEIGRILLRRRLGSHADIALARLASPVLTVLLLVGGAVCFVAGPRLRAPARAVRLLAHHSRFFRTAAARLLFGTFHHWLVVSLAMMVVSGAYLTYRCVTRPGFRRLCVEPNSVKLGRARVGEIRQVAFTLRNNSNKVIHIQDIALSCPCLTVRGFSRAILPGTAGIVNLSVEILLKGRVAYGMRVIPQEEGVASCIAQLEYEGYEATTIRPSFFNIGEFPAGATRRKSVPFRVHDYQGRAVPLTGIKATGRTRLLEAVLDGPAELSTDGQFRIVFFCKGGQVLGDFSQKFVLATGKNVTSRSFLLRVIGRLVPPLQVEPTTIFVDAALDSVNSDQRCRGETVCLRSLTDPFVIVATSSKPDVLAVTHNGTQQEQKSTLRIRLRETGTTAPCSGILTVHTSHPQTPHIEVPFFVGVPAQNH